MSNELAFKSEVAQSVLDGLQANKSLAGKENIFEEDTIKESRQRFQATINDAYIHFKLFLNAIAVSGFEEITSDINSLFHIEKINTSLNYLRKNGCSAILFSTLEDTLIHYLSFITSYYEDKLHKEKGQYGSVRQSLSQYQLTDYLKALSTEPQIEKGLAPAISVERNLSPENQLILSYFKMLFVLFHKEEISLIGRTLRRYFTMQHPLHFLFVESENLVEDMMKTPLFFIVKQNKINEQLKIWLREIRKEQLNLCKIKSDESTDKLLQVGIEDNLDKAIDNLQDKLTITQHQEQGYSLNHFRQLLPMFEEQWERLQIGLGNFYDHAIF